MIVSALLQDARSRRPAVDQRDAAWKAILAGEPIGREGVRLSKVWFHEADKERFEMMLRSVRLVDGTLYSGAT